MLQIPNDFREMKYFDGHAYDVELAHVGQGNWRAFQALGVSLLEVLEIAKSWSGMFSGIEKPWLCWNVDSDWSMVQQQLVASVGWTPIVGFDPRVGPPRKNVPSAVVIDFNKDLGLPVLYPHFPLEFAFLYCKKIAFWHSDILVRTNKFERFSRLFDGLQDGEMVATRTFDGWRNIFSSRKKRYWELLGCTTRGASQLQYEKGCGWWMDYWAHPNQSSPKKIRRNYYWDHGAGIYYWNKREGGCCFSIEEREIREGHFTKIGNASYRRFREAESLSDARRLMASEIQDNFDLTLSCKMLGLESFLQ